METGDNIWISNWNVSNLNLYETILRQHFQVVFPSSEEVYLYSHIYSNTLSVRIVMLIQC